MAISQVSHTPQRLENILLSDEINTKELLRLHTTSHQVRNTVQSSINLQRKLFLKQDPLPNGVPPGNFTTASANPNLILSSDPMSPFSIRGESNAQYTYSMTWTYREDPLSPTSTSPEQYFWSLDLFITSPASATSTWKYLPDVCLEMYLTDIPVAVVVHMRHVSGTGHYRVTDVYFPPGTKLGTVLKWQDLWCRGIVEEKDRFLGILEFEGVFCSRNLLRLEDRSEWTGDED